MLPAQVLLSFIFSKEFYFPGRLVDEFTGEISKRKGTTKLTCSTQTAIGRFPLLPSQDPAHPDSFSGRKRICIAGFDLVGSIPDGREGRAFTALAEALAAAGHEVTLLDLDGQSVDNRRLVERTAEFARRRIQFIPLPEPRSLRLSGGRHSIVAYRVYLWLKEQAFDIIHFPEWKGPGYYCLLAKHQGLAFADTLFCVQAHGPSWWRKTVDSEYMECIEDLELSFLEQESVRLADVLVSGSEYLLNWMLEAKWKLPQRTYVRQFPAPHHMNRSVEVQDSGLRAVGELVFSGSLEQRCGLALFCDTLDRMRSKPLRFRVAFMGNPGTVSGQSGVSYIQERSRNWPWPVRILTDLDRLARLNYLRGQGRLAVIPSLADNLPDSVRECLDAGVPFIASDIGGIPEMIAKEDVERTCFPLRSAVLAEKLEQALRTGVRPARPAFDIRENEAAWVSWHSQLDCMPQTHAPASEEKFAPLVSVCIPHRNRHHMLDRAIRSILAQDYTNYEIIVVDDGSDDPSTTAYLKNLETDFAARGWSLLRQENRYPGAARNLAVRHARGDYVFFMDDDNVAKPHELSTFIAIARKTGASILTCLLDIFTGDSPEQAGSDARRLLFLGPAASVGVFENRFGDSNALIKREVFDKIGGFHEIYGVNHEDRELFARAVLNGVHMEVIPEALVWYHESAGGVNNSTPLHANNMRGILPYLEAVPDCLRDLILTAQGMRYANDRMTSIAALLSEERRIQPLVVAGKTLAEMGQREAAMSILNKIMQELKTISTPGLIVEAFIGAAEFLAPVKETERAGIFLLNACKLAEETHNHSAVLKAKSLIQSLGL